MKFNKYTLNLRKEGNYIISYNTKVAEIKNGELHKLDWNVGGMTTSPTTSKHINYAANELGLIVVK